ncbi:MAG: hypothetical protein WBG57_06765, partial [Ornithinimicrobium sp.]
GLTADIVTALARRVRSSDALDQLQAGLKEIIVDPARRVTSAERRAGLHRIRNRNIRRQLDALDPAARGVIAVKVTESLRAALARRAVDAVAHSSADLVVKAFTTMRSIGPDRANPSPRGTLAKAAVQGFANLAPELVSALTSPAGGDLKWLGVHNQDMHHFELKNRPALVPAVGATEAAGADASTP